MIRQDIKKGLMILVQFGLSATPDLGNKERSEAIINAWHLYLKDFSYEQYEIAIMLYIKSNRWFPTIADIIKEIPVPNKYARPEVIYSAYIEKKEKILENNPLIKEAFIQTGYTRYYLNTLKNPSVIENKVKPKVEKRYRELIELEEKRESYRLINKSSKTKMIGE
jgi:hypothetical protein